MIALNRRILGAAFWLAVAVTLTFALLPHPPSVIPDASDKVQHALAFGVLSLLATGYYGLDRAVLIFISLAGLGGMIEVLQSIPALHRDAEWLDWATDCAAVLATLIACRVAAWVSSLAGDGP